jgi:SAM-dependent methyltransferase
MSYIETIYNENLRPITAYPDELIAHLCGRFQIPKGAKVLDVGCGRGDFLNAFKAYGLDAYGVDREPSGAKVAAGVEVRACDVEKSKFPFDDQSFDVVFSKSVIEHLIDPEFFIAESQRILKPGGRIIVMAPDWISQMKIYFDDHTHRQPYTVNAMRDLLTIKGFQDVESELFYQLPVLWRYPVLKVFSKILQWTVPVTTQSKIKFIRWSIELMVLGTGIK